MPTKEIKGPQLRDLTAALELRAAQDGGKKSISFSASSTEPYDRWYGTEVLQHDPESIRMDRVVRGAVPLLFNHNWDDPIGMVTAGRIEDSRLMVDADLFGTARAAEIEKMIEGGLRNVSIGYRVHEFLVNEKDETYTATDWEPLEISIVTVPADSTVGIGRAAADEVPARLKVSQPAAPAASQERIVDMTTAVQTPAAGQSAASQVASQEPAISARDAAAEHRQAIINLCKANNIDARVEERWIREGTPLAKVADEILQTIEERGKHKPQFAAQLGMSSRDQQRYSFLRALRVLSAQNAAESQKAAEAAAYELECSRAVAKALGREPDGLFVPADVLRRPVDETIAKRAMTASPGSAGGFLVDTNNVGFIDILRNRMVLARMGARVLSGLQGNVTVPRQTGTATVVWQAGETAAATASDQTLGQLSLTPKTAIALTEVGRTLMMQSSPSAEAMVMTDLAAGVARGVDLAGIQGSGGAQPVGIINTSGISTGQDAATADYAKILGFQSTAAGNNAILGGAGYICRPATAAVLMARSRFANTDTPLWDGNILDGRMAGFPAMSSLQVPAGNLIFGSFEEVVIGEWGVLELTMNPYQNFGAGVVGIRAMYTVDVMLRYPQAFVRSVNAS